MQTFKSFVDVNAIEPGGVVAIGNFDGMHLGHQMLLQSAHDDAKKRKVKTLAYTFSPHPSKVLSGVKKPLLMMTDEQKAIAFEKFGIDIAIFENFTQEFSRIHAEEFIDRVLVKALKVGAVVVGQNFNFGFKAQGNAQLLKEKLAPLSVNVHVIEPVLVNGAMCSSTQIRNLIGEGKMSDAAERLGRPYALTGVVVSGQGRGRTIGVPSANLKAEQELVPPIGVYKTLVRVFDENQIFKSATNIGRRPTFGDNDDIHIETHILNFNGDLYGKKIEVSFVDKIRDEQKFASIDELKTQIAKDLQIAAH